MKLYSLRIEPRKPVGWESEGLLFGKNITELFGPNGSGKTPVIQSIAYALGYPVKYRDDILAHCDAAVLVLTAKSERIELRRRIGGTFDVEVRVENGDPQAFSNERDYSQYLFALLGFPFPSLTSSGNEATVPYMATLLPVFYLDQDLGYTSAYKAPTTFIRNQYTEMTRLVFGLSPKHSFDQKKLSLEKKRRLEQLDRLVVKKGEHIATLTEELGKLRRPINAVDPEIADARASLEKLRASRDIKSDAQSAIGDLLQDKISLRRNVSNEITDLQMRVLSFNRIKNEIEVEVNTLSLNEEARRLFTSFEDICANPACGLFLGSSESYGKNPLYLRDQMKDLERNAVVRGDRVATLKIQLDATNREIASLNEKQNRLLHGDDVGGLVEAITELTRSIIALQTERASLEEIGSEEEEYVQLLNERKSVQDELASLEGSAGVGDLRAIEMRTAWRERTRHWLEVLQTKNVSRDIAIDSDFDILFGKEKMAQFHGSTLLRVVLALRTAAFEVYARDEARRLRFLILDTPRQQDIEKEALAGYVAGLKRLAIEKDAQIVFSTTEYHYECDDQDAQWSPQFPGAEQNMFLREVEQKDRPRVPDPGS
jgi:hypothetical protein